MWNVSMQLIGVLVLGATALSVVIVGLGYCLVNMVAEIRGYYRTKFRRQKTSDKLDWRIQ